MPRAISARSPTCDAGNWLLALIARTVEAARKRDVEVRSGVARPPAATALLRPV
jgi:hypothetical protein